MGDPTPTDLYRFYDSSETLLYVGISLSAAHRASQHRAEKPWWPEVARMDVEHLPSRQEALTAELAAIRTEHPIHNVVGNGARQIPKFDHDGPIEFDASFMKLEEHLAVTNAIQVVARRLDEADDGNRSAAGRTGFVHAINGLARSAVFGDCCSECDEIRQPIAMTIENKWGTGIYVCPTCRLTWACGWNTDIGWM